MRKIRFRCNACKEELVINPDSRDDLFALIGWTVKHVVAHSGLFSMVVEE